MTAINQLNAMTINDISMPIHTGLIKPDWIAAAEAKGFSIVARVINRLHLALRCHACGGLNKVARYTLMSNQPLCSHCVTNAWTADAAAAGLKFLKRDPTDRHYGIFRAACGHTVRRQFALVKRVAADETGVRCATCQASFEVAEAEARGWQLIGPDPKSDPNYRCYRHKLCGHEQRMARINVQTGRHSCGECGVDWPAAPSNLYAMAFTLASGRELVKLGYSKDPDSRLRHQLQRDPAMPCSILRVVAVPTGQDAINIEKRIHATLMSAHPKLVVDPTLYAAQIRVKSEIYDASLTQTILDHLATVERDQAERAA